MRALYLVIAIAALAVPASAQTTQGQAPAQKSGQTADPDTRSQSKMQSIARPGPNHILSSDLTGTTVYGVKNENIGEIDDVVLDREGRVVAVIVGVGGFLGIGEKSVAIPFQALEIAPATEAQNRTSSQQPQGQPMPKSSKTAKGTVQPERVVLRGMTRDDLENAPAFDDDDDDNNDNNNNRNNNRNDDNRTKRN